MNERKDKRMMAKRSGFLLWMISVTSLLWILPSAVCAGDRLKIVVSIIPQKYFVKKIGGDLVHASAMVLPGSSPATYEPKPQQMVGLTRAIIYFAVGVPFERVWLNKFARVNPEMMIVHTEEGIAKIPMKGRYPWNEKRSHGVKDPHIWLSPPLVMIQSHHIFCALANVDPVHEKVYEANYRAFIREIKALDLRISDMFPANGQKLRFMVYHPAWGYFAKAYGLEQIPVEIEGKKPAAGGLEKLILMAREKGIKVIFVQPQLASKSAYTIARSIGCRVLSADPLAEDWAKNLLVVAEHISDASKM